jgi:Uri superfamily endonuclease
MQARPGTYALVLRSPSKASVRVGRLGCIALDPGYYVYVAWAQSLSALPGLAAIANFGCSDCGCQSHLFYTTARPALNATPGIDDGDLKWVAYRGGETLQPSNR